MGHLICEHMCMDIKAISKFRDIGGFSVNSLPYYSCLTVQCVGICAAACSGRPPQQILSDAPGGAKSGSIPRHSVIFDRNLTAAAIGHSMVKRGLLQRAPHRTSVHPEQPAGINFFNMKLYILAAVAIVLGVW